MMVSDAYFRDALVALKEAKLSLMLASYDAQSDARADHIHHIAAVDGAMLAGRMEALCSQLEAVMAEIRRSRKEVKVCSGEATR
jgi:hypothetical protein